MKHDKNNQFISKWNCLWVSPWLGKNCGFSDWPISGIMKLFCLSVLTSLVFSDSTSFLARVPSPDPLKFLNEKNIYSETRDKHECQHENRISHSKTNGTRCFDYGSTLLPKWALCLPVLIISFIFYWDAKNPTFSQCYRMFNLRHLNRRNIFWKFQWFISLKICILAFLFAKYSKMLKIVGFCCNNSSKFEENSKINIYSLVSQIDHPVALCFLIQQ